MFYFPHRKKKKKNNNRSEAVILLRQMSLHARTEGCCVSEMGCGFLRVHSQDWNFIPKI